MAWSQKFRKSEISLDTGTDERPDLVPFLSYESEDSLKPFLRTQLCSRNWDWVDCSRLSLHCTWTWGHCATNSHVSNNVCRVKRSQFKSRIIRLKVIWEFFESGSSHILVKSESSHKDSLVTGLQAQITIESSKIRHVFHLFAILLFLLSTQTNCSLHQSFGIFRKVNRLKPRVKALPLTCFSKICDSSLVTASMAQIVSPMESLKLVTLVE